MVKIHHNGHGKKDSLYEEYSASQLKKLVKNIIKSQNSSFLLKGLFFLLVHGNNRIPKYVASVDDTNVMEKLNLGAMMKSESMENILNSSLLHKFGDLESNENFNNIISYNSIEMETAMMQNIGSISNTKSNCFGCFSSTSLILPKGMLRCTWKQGIPHFVFCGDESKEIYVAKLSKVEKKYDEGLDYIYLIHLIKGCQKGSEIFDNDLQVVGKMNVSTIFTLCHDNNSTIMETHFVLFGDIEIDDKEIHNSSHSLWKKKVAKVFKTSPSSSKQIKNCPNKYEPQSYGINDINLLEKNVAANFEVAAIVVKEKLPFDGVGGWGVKFLNKLPCEEIDGRKNEDCSNSMNIIVPKGVHGGPRNENGGPSSLIDRWKCGGSCDCGGWDEGCPLTVFQRRSTNLEILSHVHHMLGDYNPLDIVTLVSTFFLFSLNCEMLKFV